LEFGGEPLTFYSVILNEVKNLVLDLLPRIKGEILRQESYSFLRSSE